jgi:PhnB protein
MALHRTADDVADAERISGALSDGGEVGMPLAEVFWAQRFGMCTDRYGTPRMISVGRPTN